MDLSSILERLQALEAGVADLQQRIARLDRAAPHEEGPASVPSHPLSVSSGEGISTGFFTQLAAAAFALLGALSLRVATQEGLLTPGLGVASGCGYCVLLLATPWLGRRLRWLMPRSSLLQYCGLSLAPLIMLEMAPRLGVGPGGTSLMLGTVGLAGILAGLLSRTGRLAGYGLLVALSAIASLGLDARDLSLRGTVVVAQMALAGTLAIWKDWSYLRPTVWPVGALVLSLLVIAALHGTEHASNGSPLLTAHVVATWGLVMASCSWRARRLGVGEAFWMPLAGLWAFGLASYLAPSVALPAGIGAAAVALVFGMANARTNSAGRPFTAGLIAMASTIMALGLPVLDATGIGLATVAVLIAVAALWASSRLFMAISIALSLEAAVRGLVRCLLLSPTETSSLAIAVPGLGLALALAGHAIVAGGRPRADDGRDPLRRISATLSLGACVVVLSVSCRGFLATVAEAGELRQLLETVGLAALAIGLACLGRVWSNFVLRRLGLATVVVLAAVVLVRDLQSLTGWRLLGAVVALGTAFLTLSLTGRRGTSTRKPSVDEYPQAER